MLLGWQHGEMISVSLASSGVLRPCSSTWRLGETLCSGSVCSQRGLISSQGNTGEESPSISRRSKHKAAGNKACGQTSSSPTVQSHSEPFCLSGLTVAQPECSRDAQDF